jgi:hypothetical protein
MSDTKPKAAAPVYWIGPVPANCQMCDRPLGNTMVDAATRPQGRWGILDLKCHRIHGVGVGVGKGQVYAKQDDGRWLKIEG